METKALLIICIRLNDDRGDQGSIKFLIESKSIDVNARDVKGRTSGHYAADAGHCSVLDYLLSAGLDLHAK